MTGSTGRLVAAVLLGTLLAALAPESRPLAQSMGVRKAQEAVQGDSPKQPVDERRASEKALADAGVSAAQLDDLIEALESPEQREKLLSRLKTLQAATTGDRSGERQSGRAGGRIVERISERVGVISEELVSGAEVLLDVPRLLGWVRDQASDPEVREIWLRVVWKVLLVLGVGLAVEWAARRLLARPQATVESQERGSVLARLPLLAMRTLIDVVPILAFAAAAYIVLPFLEPAATSRLVAITLVNASVVARAIMVVARMIFVPRAAHLRLLPIGDESANYVVLWIRRLTNVSVYGYFLVEASLLLGLPEGGYHALSKLIGLLVALLLIIFIFQNRAVVGRWISGPEASPAGLRMLRRRFGDIWHVIAVLYVAAVYIVWALGIEGGFEFVFQATSLSLIIIVAAKLLLMGARKTVDHGFGVRRELMERFPGLAARANRYFAIIHVAMTVAIVFVATFAVLEAWSLDAFEWMTAPVGRRVLGSVVSSAFVVFIAIIVWEMISSVIERYLSRDGEGDIALSARARTLLPLLRKVLLVVVSTIVGFIILSEIGVNIGPLLAGAGVVGLAVGFGSQTLVKDVITGVFILAENQFAIGDVVRVSDKSGLVEDITIRTIRLRDLGGNVHIIPFSSVTTVENMTKDFSRYVFDVGVAYREDVDEVIEVLRALGEEMQADEYYGGLISEPLEIMGLDSFGDSAIVVRARITTLPIKQWEVGREFNRRIKKRFDELGIEIPFPHQTVYFGEAKGGGAPPAFVEVRDMRPPDTEGDASSPSSEMSSEMSSDRSPDTPPARVDPARNVTQGGD